MLLEAKLPDIWWAALVTIKCVHFHFMHGLKMSGQITFSGVGGTTMFTWKASEVLTLVCRTNFVGMFTFHVSPDSFPPFACIFTQIAIKCSPMMNRLNVYRQSAGVSVRGIAILAMIGTIAAMNVLMISEILCNTKYFVALITFMSWPASSTESHVTFENKNITKILSTFHTTLSPGSSLFAAQIVSVIKFPNCCNPPVKPWAPHRYCWLLLFALSKSNAFIHSVCGSDCANIPVAKTAGNEQTKSEHNLMTCTISAQPIGERLTFLCENRWLAWEVKITPSVPPTLSQSVKTYFPTQAVNIKVLQTMIYVHNNNGIGGDIGIDNKLRNCIIV